MPAVRRSARPSRVYSAASRYRLRRRSSYFSMPWHGFGPAGRYSFFVMLHASSFESTASTRFARIGRRAQPIVQLHRVVAATSAIGTAPSCGTMWPSSARRYSRNVDAFLRGLT